MVNAQGNKHGNKQGTSAGGCYSEAAKRPVGALLALPARGLCRGAAGNPRVPRLLPGTLGNFPGCL